MVLKTITKPNVTFEYVFKKKINKLHTSAFFSILYLKILIIKMRMSVSIYEHAHFIFLILNFCFF